MLFLRQRAQAAGFEMWCEPRCRAGPSAVLFFDGQPKPTDDGLIILAPAQTVSREHYPWLYSSEPTLFVLRVLLFKVGQQDKLLQPVVIGTEIKQKLKDGGYLP